MESEVFVHSLVSNLGCFVNIDDLPSLVGFSMILPDDNWSSFFISSTMYIKYSIVLNVNELRSTDELEDLPPSGVGAPGLHLIGLTRACDVP
jgi:hypothetical protein